MSNHAYKVESIIPVESTEEEILERAASISYLADFAAADALVGAAKKRGLKPLLVDKLEHLPDRGARARILGVEVRVGSPRILVEEKVAIPVSFAEKLAELIREKKMVMVVLSGRSLSGVVVLSETEREESVALEAPLAKFAPRTLVAWSFVGAAVFCAIIIVLALSYSS